MVLIQINNCLTFLKPLPMSTTIHHKNRISVHNILIFLSNKLKPKQGIINFLRSFKEDHESMKLSVSWFRL